MLSVVKINTKYNEPIYCQIFIAQKMFPDSCQRLVVNRLTVLLTLRDLGIEFPEENEKSIWR